MDRRATGSNNGLVKSNLPLKCNTGRGRGREGWREMDRKRGEKKREGRSRERKRFKEKKNDVEKNTKVETFGKATTPDQGHCDILSSHIQKY